MFCQNCGTKIDDSSVSFCPNCGARQGASSNTFSSSEPNNISNNSSAQFTGQGNSGAQFTGQGEQKDKWIAFTLALLLGTFGAHKFYEGNTKAGAIYLAVNVVGGAITFGIASLVILVLSIIDCIKYISLPNPYTPEF